MTGPSAPTAAADGVSSTIPQSPDCRGCYEKQVRRIATFCNLDDAILDKMLEIKDDLLAQLGNERVKPTHMGTLLKRIMPLVGTDDPYHDIKIQYNQLLLDREPECLAQIAAADNPFQLALRYAAAGNLIDFGSKNTFTQDDVTALLDRVPDITFALDDSAELLEQIRSAKSIMYLGDNCGEIVLDKILIEYIHQENPDAQVTFGVRGGPIINDVTVEDAKQVGMDKVARVLPSGVAIPTTIVEESTEEFQRTFYDADVIISKGMGNFETLGDGCGRGNVFFLLMTKCDLVADIISAPLMTLVCKRNAE